MDITKFKTILGKFSIIGDYFPLLVPLIIFIVALLTFIPGQLLSSSLKQQMENESISKRANKVSSYSKNTISSEQWTIEQAYQKDYENDANRISILALQACQRPLLSYKIFPEPKDTSQLIFDEFGKAYQEGIVKLLEQINARDCPTEAELEKTIQKGPVTDTSFFPGPTTAKTGRNTVSETIKDELCRAKAESASVYATPSAISGYDYWERYEYTGITQSVKDCWYWQLAYWIIEDVIKTVQVCNSGSDNVFTSPVKRIIDVGFDPGTREISQHSQADKPKYVNKTEEAFVVPCTGRISNEDIDVVHFNVTVIVNTKDVLKFMKELCSAKQHTFRGFSGEDKPQDFIHNQITTLQSHIKPINREDNMHQLYRYGNDAIVSLNLICEYIFYKKSYEQIKPDVVKTASTEM
jgi:hypothetical protein